jgi:hypothetical protein
MNYRKITYIINRCFDCYGCEKYSIGDIPPDCPLEKSTKEEYDSQ